MQFASDHEPERGLLECHLASIRLRTAVAALEWKRAGNENIFRDPEQTEAGGVNWITARLCVVPKFYIDGALEPWLDACHAAKRNGCPLVLDVTDNPFSKPSPVPEFYSEVLKICDAVVVNSERMGEIIAPRTSHRPVVIEDAILAPMSEPAFAPAAKIELLWFGHTTNLRYLDAVIGVLAQFALQRRCRLTVVTEYTHPA